MWIAAFIAGWVLGSVSLYTYLVFTAKEPRNEECVDCRLTDCAECPYKTVSLEELKRAA